MTNEEAKLKVIKNAYGIHWDMVKDHVDKNGWIANKYLGFSDFVLYEPFHKEGYWDDDLKQFEAKFIPVSLSGIDNNNGWIRINSVDDLPKEVRIDVIINGDPYEGYVYQGQRDWFCHLENRYNQKLLDDIIEAKHITHYQRINKPKQPIY